LVFGLSTPALLVLGGVAVASGVLGKGTKTLTKTTRIFNVTKGVVGDLVIGAGAGAFINVLDTRFGNGFLASKFIGNPVKGQNLNGTDAILALMTTGLGFSKKTLFRFAPFLGGKKIAEFLGAIDPPGVPAQSGASFSAGAPT